MQIQAAAAPAAASAMPRVRVATPDDIDEVIDMGRQLHAENGLMSLDDNLICQVAENAILNNSGVVGVIGEPGHLEAMIFIELRKYWYSNECHLEEMLNFVRAEYRRSKNAIALIEFAKSQADKLGIPLLIGILSNRNTEQKIKLYQRRLGKPSGAYWIYNGNTGD